MKAHKLLPFQDVYEIIPEIHLDNRGYFYESFQKNKLKEIIKKDIEFVQDNHSSSSKYVIRGMHFQEYPVSQQKLLRCIKGRVLEIVVNINPNSTNFLKHIFLEISEKKMNQIFIPNGYAHGFLSLENGSQLIYKTDNFYSAKKQITLFWDDPILNIKWPLDKRKFITSIRDKKAIMFKDYFNLQHIQ